MRALAAIVLAAATTACGAPTPRDLAAATSYTLAREHGRYVRVDDLDVFAIELGSGRDLVLLHGNPASTYTWRKLIAPLAGRYRVHAIDLPGFGFSDKPDDASYTTGWLARVVSEYMAAAGLDTAIVVGNSMGGEVATELAALYRSRVSGLVLLAPTGLAAGPMRERPLRLRLLTWPGIGPWIVRLPAQRFVAKRLSEAVFDATSVTDDDIDAFYAPLRTRGGMNGFSARAALAPVAGREALVRSIGVPTVIIVGDSDTLVDPEVSRRYHRLISGSTLVEIPETGHLPQEERAGIVVAEIDELAARVP